MRAFLGHRDKPQLSGDVTYYNDNEPYVCAWLRNLIAEGYLPDGEVDDRSILAVQPSDLPDTCHFFAGIGGWPYALRLAGWPDDRPAWTASLPCQPWSAAGKSGGVEDERHLWPAFFRLVAERRPPTIFGEQVSAAIALGWLDGIFDDLEGIGYACGAVVIPACSVGAPHIRKRIFWVAESASARRAGAGQHDGRPSPLSARSEQCGEDGFAADGLELPEGDGRQQWRPESGGRGAEPRCESERMGNTDESRQQGRSKRPDEHADQLALGAASQPIGLAKPARAELQGQPSAGPRQRPWDSSQVIWCRDGKYRRIPAEPAFQPLADAGEMRGRPRVGVLRAAGNSIVAEAAAEFVRAFMEARL